MTNPAKTVVAISTMVVVGFLFASAVEASSGFSGSNINNYTCPTLINATNTPTPQDQNGRFVCIYSVRDPQTGLISTEIADASARPPYLSVIQVWFVRFIYILWAAAGVVFTGILMWLGFKYMTSFGNEVALAEVVKGFRKWLIGLALIFLSYPVLNTVFNVLPINRSNNCFSQISMPGFQFFFPQACRSIEEQCESRYGPPPAPQYPLCVSDPDQYLN